MDDEEGDEGGEGAVEVVEAPLDLSVAGQAAPDGLGADKVGGRLSLERDRGAGMTFFVNLQARITVFTIYLDIPTSNVSASASSTLAAPPLADGAAAAAAPAPTTAAAADPAACSSSALISSKANLNPSAK